MEVSAIERILKKCIDENRWTAEDECSEVATDLKKKLNAGTIVTFIRPKSDRLIQPFAIEVWGRPSYELLEEGYFDYHTVVCVKNKGVQYIVDPFKARKITPITEYVEDLRRVNNTPQKFVYFKGDFNNHIVDWSSKLEKANVEWKAL